MSSSWKEVERVEGEGEGGESNSIRSKMRAGTRMDPTAVALLIVIGL